MPTYIKVEHANGEFTIETVKNKISCIPISRTNNNQLLLIGDHSLKKVNSREVQLTTVVSQTNVWLGNNFGECYVPSFSPNVMLIEKSLAPVRLNFLNPETDIKEIQISRKRF